jgi:hypothetical protein
LGLGLGLGLLGLGIDKQTIIRQGNYNGKATQDKLNHRETRLSQDKIKQNKSEDTTITRQEHDLKTRQSEE